MARRATTRAVAKAARLRVVAYFRVSQDRWGNKKSVADQAVEFAENLADNPQWMDVGRFSDNSLSASRFARRAREEFGRLVAMIEAGDVDVVWLWEVSRFARFLAVFIPLRELCRQRGLKWYVYDERRLYDFTNPADVEELTNRAVKAEQESEQQSRRVRRGMRANLRNGKPHGRPKYGYRRRYDDRTGELIAQEIDPENGPIVVEIATRFAAGVAINVIKTDLEKRGVLTPYGRKVWSPVTIKEIATSPVYLGKRVYKRGRQSHEDGSPFAEIHEGAWPAIIEEQTHLACLRRIQLPPSRKWTRPSRPRHLLTNIMTCGGCGGPIGPNKHQGTNAGPPPYYTCRQRGCVVVSMSTVDPIVLAELYAWLAREDVWDLVMKPETSQAARRAHEEAAALRAELAEWVQAVAKGRQKISPVAFAEIEAGYTERIEAADRRAAELSMPGPLATLLRGRGSAKKRFEALDLGQQRDVLNRLFVIELGRGHRGRVPIKDRIVMTPRFGTGSTKRARGKVRAA